MEIKDYKSIIDKSPIGYACQKYCVMKTVWPMIMNLLRSIMLLSG